MNWYPVELHTHTEHSDGTFTPAALAQAACARGFAACALTDHNTVSGLREFVSAAEPTGLLALRGIEWTTYWGHMLVLGEQGYTDWRGVTPTEIDRTIAQVHQNSGIVGIAHPFALSNPINTGYHWEFQVSDWDAVDFLEVWSRDDAPRKVQSLRAFALWEQLLNRGCRITATSGRDWHGEDDHAYTHTYIGAHGACTERAVLDAVRAGRVCLSAGSMLTLCAQGADGDEVQIGSEIRPGDTQLILRIEENTMPNDWQRAQVQPTHIGLVHNGKTVLRCPVQAEQRVHLPLAAGWLRAELIGGYYGMPAQRIACTNPLFLQEEGCARG